MFRFGTTLTSTINFMTRGFDDLTLTFYKFFNPIWVQSQNNLDLIKLKLQLLTL